MSDTNRQLLQRLVNGEKVTGEDERVEELIGRDVDEFTTAEDVKEAAEEAINSLPPALFQVRTRPDLKSEWTDFKRVRARNVMHAMRLVDVPDFTMLTAVEVEPDQTIPAEYVETAMRRRLDDLAELVAISRASSDGGQVLDEIGRDRIAAALACDPSEAASLTADEANEEAVQRLDEYPLCVEATTTFEIVIGTGGPDDRILVECNTYDKGVADHGPDHQTEYEIRRVLYRYSWEGSAEVELHGDDKEVAEAFARRVVPELVE